MFYYFLVPLSDQVPLFNVIRYITFRAGAATMTAMFVCFLFGPVIIRWLKARQQNGQPIREDGPESHLIKKKGTPTMGGVMILLGVFLGTLLWPA